MCTDDLKRNNEFGNGAVRYGWFSSGEINTDCSWFRVNAARKQLGADIVDEWISDSLQFTERDSVLLKMHVQDIDNVWKKFEEKIVALSDIVNYKPVFEKCMYQGFEEFRKDNVQYIEV